MPNRLADSTSPYLRQHQDNPVDWHEWGEEAFAEARRRDVPVLLSVGYSACHWCHVMAHESFEDDATAAQMNDEFVNIKVDREERPDVDAVYMEAVQALSGRGGWPMTVWLHPDGRPFYAGTYYPKEARGGMPPFRSVLDAITDAWTNRRDELGEQADRLTHAISQAIPAGDLPGEDVLQGAYEQLVATFDAAAGGFGGAPKFPQQPVLEFLLRIRDREWAVEADRMLSTTLAAMARGGIRDQLGGGFARYAVDGVWLVPHFEKMLYDNAQLARLYLWAGTELGVESFRAIAEETLDYMRRDLRHADGGFFSAEDADSEGEEGKFYVFSGSEFDRIVGDEDAPIARKFFGVTDAGNFEGTNVLHIGSTVEEIATDQRLDPDAVSGAVERARTALFAARSSRTRPGLDHKVVASWNGIAIRAFAEAGMVLDRSDLVEDAASCARFVLERMRGPDGRIVRSWSEGKASPHGFLEDQAAVALGLFTLYQVTGDLDWFRHAERLTRLIPELYADAVGGFFSTASDAEALVKRPKDQFDNPLPSGNSMAAEALLWLSLYTGEPAISELVDGALRSGALLLERYPSGAGHLAAVLGSIHRGTTEIAVAGGDPEPFRRAFWNRYRPGAVIATSPATGDDIALMADRDDGGTTRAYVCRDFVCNLPVTEPGAMISQL